MNLITKPTPLRDLYFGKLFKVPIPVEYTALSKPVPLTQQDFLDLEKIVLPKIRTDEQTATKTRVSLLFKYFIKITEPELSLRKPYLYLSEVRRNMLNDRAIEYWWESEPIQLRRPNNLGTARTVNQANAPTGVMLECTKENNEWGTCSYTATSYEKAEITVDRDDIVTKANEIADDMNLPLAEIIDSVDHYTAFMDSMYDYLNGIMYDEDADFEYYDSENYDYDDHDATGYDMESCEITNTHIVSDVIGGILNEIA